MASVRPLALLVLVQLAASAGEVELSETPSTFTLSNGEITARIEKRSGNLVSLKFADLDLLQGGRGYWSQVGSSSKFGSPKAAAVTIDPRMNTGARGEVACRFAGGGESGALPLDIELRYTLGKDDHGIYATAIWRHRDGWPAFSIGEGRYAVKLNPNIFDYMSIDAKRQRLMPTGADWDRGAPTNLKEARRLTTGRYAGSVEHKYDYSAILSEVPAYGWSSTTKKVGLWVVNPSQEYIAGGPTKVELTGHLDVNAGGAPTLLNMWLGSHYGGSSLAVAQDENWSKVIGPFLLYANAGSDPEGLWKDALAQASKEASAWPYSWLQADEYPLAAARGTLRGRIVLDDSPATKLSNLQVGLAAPDYQSSGLRRRELVDWQREGKYYQHWSRADGDGNFTISKVRPGTYTLHAIANGVLGEFARANVIVKAGETLDLGTLTWHPVRYGRQLWEIGVPDRTAAEFRHGDDYWHWGLYLQYPREFPDDVNFVIGKSDPRRDWNYVQPPRIDANGRVERPTTWRISFDLPEAPRGKATLRLAIAGSRTKRGINVAVNDVDAGNSGPLPDTGVMHRDGIRGAWCERRVSFDASLLRAGTNIISLTVPAQSWVEGVLYDYLRLELDPSDRPRN